MISLPKRPGMTAWVILILMAIVCIVGYATLPASRHYKLFGDQESLYRTLSQLEPGTTLSELEHQLGPAVVVGEQRRLMFVNAHKDQALKRPKDYPDGVTDDDKFIEFPANRPWVTLWVRDEKLVNFDPSEFRDGPQAVSILNNLAGK